MWSIISNGRNCQYNLVVFGGPITFLWVLPLQMTIRVANVDDNNLTYNRPSQKIIKEMHVQLAVFLPLKEFFSIYKFSNVTDSRCKQFRAYICLCEVVYCSKIPSNQSPNDLHQLFRKKKKSEVLIIS